MAALSGDTQMYLLLKFHCLRTATPNINTCTCMCTCICTNTLSMSELRLEGFADFLYSEMFS